MSDKPRKKTSTKTDPQPQADPGMVWAPSKIDDLRGSIRVTGVTTNYTLYWGDSKADTGKPNATTFHTYKDPGVYTVALRREGQVNPFLYTTFRVLPKANTQLVTVEQDPDAEYTVKVTLNETEQPGIVPRYSIQWDNQNIDQVIAEPGTVRSFYYGSAGKHTLRITDKLSGLPKSYIVELTDPVYDPDLTVTKDTTDPDGRTAKLAVTNATGTDRKLEVLWDDGTAPEEISAAVGTTVSHAYTLDSTYQVVARYTDDHTAYKVLDFTVPLPDEA